MGWLQLAGSLKSNVSFAKETCKRDDILKKKPMIFRSLLIVATPYVHVYVYMDILYILYTLSPRIWRQCEAVAGSHGEESVSQVRCESDNGRDVMC